MIKKLLKTIFNSFYSKNYQDKIEKYLSKSEDAYDLDIRLKELDKKIKKKERSNLNKIKSLGLVDKNGNPL